MDCSHVVLVWSCKTAELGKDQLLFSVAILLSVPVADLGLAKGGFYCARENFRATPICALATPTLIKDAQLLILCIVLDRAQGLPIDQYSFSITRR